MDKNKIKLLIGGSPCFPAGNVVLTDQGYKDIKDIEIGDMVLTHQNCFKKVIDKFSHAAETYDVKITGFPTITTTANHPFLTMSRRRKWNNERKSYDRIFENTKWTPAIEMTEDNFCAMNIWQSKNINEYNLDEETCWLLGRYVADGHYRKDKRKDRKNSYQYQFIISVGKNKVEDFTSHINKRKYNCYPHSQSVYRCVFSSKELVDFVIKMNFGKGAGNKRIPLFIYDLPLELRESFLEGYMSGDGSYNKQWDSWRATTISKELAYGLQMLWASVYRSNAGVSYHVTKPTTIIEGRIVNQNPQYTLVCKKGLRIQSVTHLENNKIWTQVKSIQTTNRIEAVYNLQVEDDESYTINNVIVHNCTFWSVAQKNNRETEASGMGWELFRNFLIAKEKFQPDFFLYENNASASKAIKDQIAIELGYPLQNINSALLSAQQRKRIYCHNWDCPQPEDKGVLLKDILEFSDSVVEKEKAYCLCTDHMGTTRDYFKKHQSQVIFEPVCVAQRGRYNAEGKVEQHYEPRLDGKTNTITTVQKDNLIAEPVRVGDIGSNSQAHRVYSCYGKSVNLVANGGGQGAKTGLYFTPLPDELVGLVCDKGKIYEIVDGYIETKVGRYKCNMPDGHYIIRKLTVTEAARLQTMPDDYTKAPGVSNQQQYKALGNGWTADVIIFMLEEGLKDIPRDTPLEVLSMYDGIATGLYCLKKMGFTNIKYYATEIDPYAIKIALHNHPEIIELGDAFQVREDDWSLSE